MTIADFAILAQPELGAWVRQFGYPFVRAAHVFGACLCIGGVIVFDVRAAFSSGWDSVDSLHRLTFPVVMVGFVLALFAGYALFSAQPVQSLDNGAFQFKLAALALATLNALAFETILLTSNRRASWPFLRTGAVISISAWFLVVLFSAWIMYW